MKKNVFTILIGMLILAGCAHEHSHDVPNSHEDHSVAVTQWTDKMELFMEYETAVKDTDIKFIIHLTTLSDFQPVREGKVRLNFTNENGEKITFEQESLLREGIFTPIKSFAKTGSYHFSLSYEGKKTSEQFEIGNFTVYESHADLPKTVEEDAGSEIGFLKEQQWKIDFATEEVQKRSLKSSVQAVGTVKASSAGEVVVMSPVEGIISLENSKKMVKPGQAVQKGETLVIIQPPLAASNSWSQLYLNYAQSKTEYERAKRLKQKGALSDKEWQLARNRYEKNRAGMASYFSGKEQYLKYDAERNTFVITAPMSGIITEMDIRIGEKVTTERKLFHIINPNKVWLKIDLFPKQAAGLDAVLGVSLQIPGRVEPLHLNSKQVQLLSTGRVLHKQKRTVTIWLEVENATANLLIGQNFTAQLYTAQTNTTLAVPQSAVYEEDGKKIVFIHTSGEGFEKREVELGIKDNNYIAIHHGINSGERVVTHGGYFVKLASTSEAVGHPHAH